MNPHQKNLARQFPPGEFPRYFFKYQTELRLTVSSYYQTIIYKNKNKIYKCWLYDRKGLVKERNKRHVFAPILHGKIIPGLKGTVIKRQICW